MRFLAAASFFAAAASLAQSQLDQPGEKKVTLRSEIARGASEISSSQSEHVDISLTYLEEHVNKVILQNKSRQKDSDGFMLGARVEQLKLIDVLLSLEGLRDFNSQEAITAALDKAHQYALDIRKLQKKLGVDDDALIVDALGYTREEGANRVKRRIANYEAGTSAPTERVAPAESNDKVVTLTKSVSIQTPKGSVTLPGGSKLPIISRDGDILRFHYGNADYEIPVDATELAK
jgi:uncharacterized phage infection (PIP) family protein YhgE